MKQLTLFDMDDYIEDVACPMCGGVTERNVAIELDNFYVSYLSCESCGHMYNARKEEYVPDKYRSIS